MRGQEAAEPDSGPASVDATRQVRKWRRDQDKRPEKSCRWSDQDCPPVRSISKCRQAQAAEAKVQGNTERTGARSNDRTCEDDNEALKGEGCRYTAQRHGYLGGSCECASHENCVARDHGRRELERASLRILLVQSGSGDHLLVIRRSGSEA